MTSLIPLSNQAGAGQQVKKQGADLETSFWPRHWTLKSLSLWKVPHSLMVTNVRTSTLLPMDKSRNLWSLNTCLLQPVHLPPGSLQSSRTSSSHRVHDKLDFVLRQEQHQDSTLCFSETGCSSEMFLL